MKLIASIALVMMLGCAPAHAGTSAEIIPTIVPGKTHPGGCYHTTSDGLWLVSVPCPDAGPKDQSWHLLTKSFSGTVSLLKDLSKEACEFSQARLTRQPATPEEKARAAEAWQRQITECEKHTADKTRGCNYVGGAVYMPNPGDIQTAECFQ